MTAGRPTTRSASARRAPAAAAGMGVALVLLPLWPSAGLAQKGRADVREGNRLYSEGQYAEAHEKYLEALRNAPNSPLIRFNDGNALYQTREFQRATDAFRAALESGDPALESKAWYNMGNALYRQQQLEESLEAYKQALRRDPMDVDAKHNLELVREQLQQQNQGRQDDQQQQEQQQRQDQQQDGPGQQQQQQRDQQDQEQQGQDGQQDRQRDPSEQDQRQGAPDDRSQQQQRQPQPAPGQMSREEAERLLQAIAEDQGEIQRQRVPSVRRRVRKPW